MNNYDIAKAWANNKAVQRKYKALSTDGDDLYSYALLIGYTNDQGKKVAIDYTRTGGDYRSNTTSTHVGLAKELCSLIRSPILQDKTVPVEVPKDVYDPKTFTKKRR
jgi:hypothetical protein